MQSSPPTFEEAIPSQPTTASPENTTTALERHSPQPQADQQHTPRKEKHRSNNHQSQPHVQNPCTTEKKHTPRRKHTNAQTQDPSQQIQTHKHRYRPTNTDTQALTDPQTQVHKQTGCEQLKNAQTQVHKQTGCEQLKNAGEPRLTNNAAACFVCCLHYCVLSMLLFFQCSHLFMSLIFCSQKYNTTTQLFYGSASVLPLFFSLPALLLLLLLFAAYIAVRSMLLHKKES